jgi:hypothetical protein
LWLALLLSITLPFQVLRCEQLLHTHCDRCYNIKFAHILRALRVLFILTIEAASRIGVDKPGLDMYDTVNNSLIINVIYHGDITAQQYSGMHHKEIQVQAPARYWIASFQPEPVPQAPHDQPRR